MQSSEQLQSATPLICAVPYEYDNDSEDEYDQYGYTAQDRYERAIDMMAGSDDLSAEDYYEQSINDLIDALIAAYEQSNDSEDDYDDKVDAILTKHKEESIYEYERLYDKKIDLEELCREAFKPSRVMYQQMIDPNY